jgi:hypothetical protein
MDKPIAAEHSTEMGQRINCEEMAVLVGWGK